MWLCLASDTAVCRLSKELDFMRPRVGPSAPLAGGSSEEKEKVGGVRSEKVFRVYLRALLWIFTHSLDWPNTS